MSCGGLGRVGEDGVGTERVWEILGEDEIIEAHGTFHTSHCIDPRLSSRIQPGVDKRLVWGDGGQVGRGGLVEGVGESVNRESV